MATTIDQSGPTLTNITHGGRMFVKYGVIVIVGLMVGRVLLNASVAYWKATHPKPPPPPTVGFGKLPKINFPTQISEDTPSEYNLEMPTNSFPVFGDRAKVFLIPATNPSLLADQAVKKVAAQFRFVFEPESINSRTYRWTRSQPLETSIDIDVQTQNFSLKTDYLARPELLLNNNLPENYEAVDKIKSFLDSADLLGSDIASSAGKVTYLKSLGGELTEAFSLSDADFVKIDLDRYPVDEKYEMYSPNGEDGIISAIITGVISGTGGIVDIDYRYNPTDPTELETYPIRSTRDAWKTLQGGEGYIANKGENETAVVRDVVLGYYDDWEQQDYLQPIYVFIGDDGFIGYVPAIDARYIQ